MLLPAESAPLGRSLLTRVLQARCRKPPTACGVVQQGVVAGCLKRTLLRRDVLLWCLSDLGGYSLAGMNALHASGPQDMPASLVQHQTEPWPKPAMQQTQMVLNLLACQCTPQEKLTLPCRGSSIVDEVHGQP